MRSTQTCGPIDQTTRSRPRLRANRYRHSGDTFTVLGPIWPLHGTGTSVPPRTSPSLRHTAGDVMSAADRAVSSNICTLEEREPQTAGPATAAPPAAITIVEVAVAAARWQFTRCSRQTGRICGSAPSDSRRRSRSRPPARPGSAATHLRAEQTAVNNHAQTDCRELLCTEQAAVSSCTQTRQS